METPRKGSKVIYRGEYVGEITKTDGNIAHYVKPNGEHSLFIWRFERNALGAIQENFNTLHEWGSNERAA